MNTRLILLRRLAAISALVAVAFAALPARSSRRPRYGGTLRVEIGATVASLDPDVTAATAEEAAAKLQIDSLIFDHRDADGEFAGAAGSGAFRVTAFEAGKRVMLAANEEFREGRPFVDAVEIAMGRASHERLVDLELSKTDLAEIAPQDARRAGEQGVRVSLSQPDELLALVFVGGNARPDAAGKATSQGNEQTRAAAAEQAMGQSTIVGYRSRGHCEFYSAERLGRLRADCCRSGRAGRHSCFRRRRRLQRIWSTRRNFGSKSRRQVVWCWDMIPLIRWSRAWRSGSW